MCEMNLWLKRLNKHIPPYWDGLATAIVSQGLGKHASVCVCLLFSSNVSYFTYNGAFIWIHFTTIHPSNIHAHQYTFFKVAELTGTTWFHIKRTSSKPRWHKPYNNVLHLQMRCSYSIVYICSASWEQGEQSHARLMHVPVNKKGFVFLFQTARKKEGGKHMQMRPDTLDHTHSKIWALSIVCKIWAENNHTHRNTLSHRHIRSCCCTCEDLQQLYSFTNPQHSVEKQDRELHDCYEWFLVLGLAFLGSFLVLPGATNCTAE